MNKYAAEVLSQISKTYPWEKEFINSIEENFKTISLFLDTNEALYPTFRSMNMSI
jgi:hypothetical protein